MARKILGIGRDIKNTLCMEVLVVLERPRLTSTLQTPNKDVNSGGSLEEGNRIDKRLHKTQPVRNYFLNWNCLV